MKNYRGLYMLISPKDFLNTLHRAYVNKNIEISFFNKEYEEINFGIDLSRLLRDINIVHLIETKDDSDLAYEQLARILPTIGSITMLMQDSSISIDIDTELRHVEFDYILSDYSYYSDGKFRVHACQASGNISYEYMKKDALKFTMDTMFCSNTYNHLLQLLGLNDLYDKYKEVS